MWDPGWGQASASTGGAILGGGVTGYGATRRALADQHRPGQVRAGEGVLTHHDIGPAPHVDRLGAVVGALVSHERDRGDPGWGAAVAALVTGGDEALRIYVTAGVTRDHHIEGGWLAVVEGLETVRVRRTAVTLRGDV